MDKYRQTKHVREISAKVVLLEQDILTVEEILKVINLTHGVKNNLCPLSQRHSLKRDHLTLINGSTIATLKELTIVLYLNVNLHKASNGLELIMKAESTSEGKKTAYTNTLTYSMLPTTYDI